MTALQTPERVGDLDPRPPSRVMAADDPRHGTTRGFHAGCREACCRAAIARYQKEGRHLRHQGLVRAVPAIGAQRRIRALMRLGWTGTDIAEALGWSHRNSVRRILVGQNGKPCNWIERRTHYAVAEVYERLCMVIPPRKPCRARTRTQSERKGWPPPLAWTNIDDPREKPTRMRTRDDRRATTEVDPVVVERLLAGRRVDRSTRAEKDEAMRRWLAMGKSEKSLCEVHGWKESRYGRAAA